MNDQVKAIASGLCVGLLFGTGLEKSKVYLPMSIRDQMLFKEYIMLKVFLMATATGMIATAILCHFNITARVAKANSIGLGTRYGGNILGGIIMGAGILIGGACPGTAFAQLGAGVSTAKFVILGGIAGALVFGYLHGYLTKRTRGQFLKREDSLLLDQWLQVPLWNVSAGMASVLVTMVFVIEKLFPSEIELATIVGHPVSAGFWPSPTQEAWSPILGGIVIGLCQIPSILLIGAHLGASASYVTCAYFCVDTVDKSSRRTAPYFASFASKTDIAQLASVIGIGVGAFLSSWISGTKPPVDHSGLSNLSVFIGGFLMIFGARLAGGCASGHGLSGMAKLSLASVITVASMFVGAIGAALIFS